MRKRIQPTCHGKSSSSHIRPKLHTPPPKAIVDHSTEALQIENHTNNGLRTDNNMETPHEDKPKTN
ncbi:hypothetical protein C0J52_14982 [Blattella germanica]|nr:hypothetical protein C0J52_14982 [Blattella germanica]